jgi:hypothetical protein
MPLKGRSSVEEPPIGLMSVHVNGGDCMPQEGVRNQRLRRLTAVAMAVSVVTMAAGCDSFPVLDKLGAQRSPEGDVRILFGACPGETVQGVALELSDDKFKTRERELWSVKAIGIGSADAAFTVGRTPPGFREVTALDKQLEPKDHVTAVVTSSRSGAILSSFIVGDLKTDQVTMRYQLDTGSPQRTREEFAQTIREFCSKG